MRTEGRRGQSPLTAHGHHDASRDPDQITAWWRRWPQAMIGAPVPESLLVIDVDPRNGGSIAEPESLTGPLPATLTAWSGRNDGGRHLYYMRPASPTTSTRLPEGIDLKTNGYCIVPPSMHPATGMPYRWQEHPVAALPYNLRELVRPAPRPVQQPTHVTSKDGSALVRYVAGAAERQRNKILFWAACRAAEKGIIDALASDLISAAVSAGLSDLEARKAVASASKTAASSAPRLCHPERRSREPRFSTGYMSHSDDTSCSHHRRRMTQPCCGAQPPTANRRGNTRHASPPYRQRKRCASPWIVEDFS